ncbi:glycoside hydrolase [Ophiobolus disseminans]|uniref:Glycoside hydrolase n=1 Tax=Ophiobolus disseminans TaxID=1469910 RepID=A0A6A6ZRA7_9PLEO|nr:glycoside hydrolase [Ophiobolus disseminans]
MSLSTLARAATAATFLVSTASAAYSAGASTNVAVYWGQGNAQEELAVVCDDPSFDIVNIAFVNGFPLKRGDYPVTNFANACGDQWFQHPTDPTQNKKLLSHCPGIAPGIAKCRANGKKVLLSLGGGSPTNYYLPSKDVADYFAEFLTSAFGPKKDSWTGPRPFGDEFVDGFDLDLEANANELPSSDLIFANYAYFVNQLKAYQPSALISAAPQCQVPDPRLADAIKNSNFDMIFTQFYNTYECSAKRGYEELTTGGNGFTFNTWAEWLKANSKNQGVKLYMGLPAGEDGLPTHKDHYLKPDQADLLIKKWKAAYPEIFGGVMVWEAKVSSANQVNCKSFGYWMKATLDGRFTKEFKACVSSSSVAPSSTKASSTKASSTSAAATPTATIPTTDGTCGDQKNGIAHSCYGWSTGSCCSNYGYCGGNPEAAAPRDAYCGVSNCNPLFGDCDGKTSSVATSTAKATSSSKIVSSSSSKIVSSSATSKAVSSSATSKAVSSSATSKAVSSSATSKAVSSSSSKAASSSAAPSSSAHGSSSIASSSAPASSHVASSSAVSSSIVVSSSSASIHASSTASAHVSSSAVSSAVSTPAASSAVSSTVHNVPSSSILYPTGNVTFTPYPTGTHSSSATPSIVYPLDTTKQVYPHSSSELVYPSSSSSGLHYGNNATTPCTTSTKVPTSTPIYGTSTTPGHPVYGVSSSSTPGAPVYGASSSSGKGYDSYPPLVTSVPGKDYASVPSSSTVKTITTTYVDSCETGVTTKTETITQTVCNKCQGDSVTSVYVCNKCGPSVVTITITKPNTPTTNVPSYPTPPTKPEGPTYGGDKPSTPSQGGDKPSNPPTYGGDKPQPPAHSSQAAKPTPPVYGADVPKKQEVPVVSTTVAIVYVTKTPVPVVPSVKHTPIPYPSAPVVEYSSKPVVGTGVPSKPSGTGVPTKPTGTGVPTNPTYAPPQFTGAASHVGVGMTGLFAVVAGLLVL